MNRNALVLGNGGFDAFFKDFASLFDSDTERRLMHTMQERCGKVDVRENDKEYIVEADLPGFAEEDIDISIKDGVLTLSCKKESSNEKKDDEKKDVYLIKERSCMEFRRSFNFADHIDEDKITAIFDNGVLEVRMPKKEERSSRQIKVNCQKQLNV